MHAHPSMRQKHAPAHFNACTCVYVSCTYGRFFPAATFFAAGCVFANFRVLFMGPFALLLETFFVDP